MVPCHPYQVIVAGDDPRLIFFVPVDGIHLPQVAEVGIGISDDLWGKQIVVNSRNHNTSQLL
jgi:hypothetical protein